MNNNEYNIQENLYGENNYNQEYTNDDTYSDYSWDNYNSYDQEYGDIYSQELYNQDQYYQSATASKDFANSLEVASAITFLIFFVVALASSIIMLISQWKIFKKAGKGGWECLIPIYNVIVLLEIVELPIWYIVLSFIPFANIYLIFKLYIELAHKFNRSTGFGILTIFFPIICFPILAFSKKSVYQKTSNNDDLNNQRNQDIMQQSQIAETINNPYNNQAVDTTTFDQTNQQNSQMFNQQTNQSINNQQVTNMGLVNNQPQTQNYTSLENMNINNVNNQSVQPANPTINQYQQPINTVQQSVITNGVKFCPNCGSQLNQEVSTCPNCNIEII